MPRGLFEPVLCRTKTCRVTKPVMRKGTRKWSVKKRIKVGLLTENPPHNQYTNSEPK